MKNYLFIITLLFVSIGWSQSVEFKIVNEDQEAVPFAQVYFSDLNYGGVCDSNGVYQHEFKVRGLIDCVISASEFKTVQKSIEIKDSDVQIVITMHELHFDIEEVVVKSGLGELQGSNTSGVERMSIEELNEIGNQDLGANLNQIKGVNVLSNGPGLSKPIIRGLSGVRVITYYDGLRIENQQWGNDHGLGINSPGVGAVEVVKGPASLLYGADAIGGVLYITDASFVENDHSELSINTGFSSNSLSSNSSVVFKTSKKDFKINIFGSARTDSDYQLPNGDFLTNSRFYNYSGGINLAYHKKRWFTNLRYNAVYNVFGLAGHTHDSIATLDDFVSTTRERASTVPWQNNFNNYVLWNNKWFLKNGKVRLSVGYTRTHLKEHDEKVTVAALELLQNNITSNLHWEGNFGKNKIIVGNQNMFGLVRNGVNAEERLIPNYNQLDAGVFGVYQRTMNDWVVRLGARYDLRNVDLTDTVGTTTYHGINFSTGVSYNSDNWGLRINISSGIRPPHVSELYSNGPHHGSNRYELGNPNLKAENAYQFDVEWEGKFEHISFSINPFYNYINNYIAIEERDTMLGGHNVFEYTQYSSAQLFGGEVGVHYHPHFAHWLHLESNFSYVYTIDSKGEGISFTPPGSWTNSVRVLFKPKKFLKQIQGTIRYTYFMSQNNRSFYETASKSYHMLDIGVNMTFKMKQPLSLRFGVQNALNQEFVPHLSNLKSLNIPNPGYNIYVGLQWDLKFDKH